MIPNAVGDRRYPSGFDEILFNPEISNDEVLPLRGVFPHVETRAARPVVEVRSETGSSRIFLADEVLELVRPTISPRPLKRVISWLAPSSATAACSPLRCSSTSFSFYSGRGTAAVSRMCR